MNLIIEVESLNRDDFIEAMRNKLEFLGYEEQERRDNVVIFMREFATYDNFIIFHDTYLTIENNMSVVDIPYKCIDTLKTNSDCIIISSGGIRFRIT